MVRYVSTRNRNAKLKAHEAIIKGLADDGGLYTPIMEQLHVDPSELIDCTYQQQAEKIIGTLFDDYSEEEIRNCAEGAYDSKFDDPGIVPIKQFHDGWLMELWHGPTSAFKDIALTILPRLLTAAYQKEDRDDTVAILTATSGDTGKAALSGFADVPDTYITVFYPEIGVSDTQKLQMRTSTGNNVDVIAVKGNFDDCQRMVKEAAASKLVRDACHHVTISSANSINIGRLVPQAVYYYHAYCELIKQGAIKCGDEVNFIVPTGNFGDILAGYLAYMLGLPIHKLICASNKNNVLTDFIHTGVYDAKRPFYNTMSPSMDILISSNLERLLFLLSDGDDAYVSSLMKQLNEEGRYEINDELKKRIDERFAAYWTDENDCSEAIRNMYEQDHILIDPHTSVAVHAMREYQKESGDERPCIVLSTASPYKFSRDVYRSLTGKDEADDYAAMRKLNEKTGVTIPYNLSSLHELPIRFDRVIDPKDGMKVIAAKMEELSHD